MTTLIRFTVSLACALGVAHSLAVAQPPASVDAPAALPPELAAMLAAQPNWSSSASVDASYGFKDNLLLSHSGEERSAFARGSVEFLLLRVPQGKFDYSLYTQAEHTHFFSSETVDHTAKAWLQTEPGYRVTDTLKLSLPLTGYYNDQVFDVSDTEVERLVAKLKVTGAMVGPTVRWAFHRSWWMEAQAVGERKSYEDGTNNGDVGEGTLRLAWTRGERFEARLTGTRRWRGFDRRVRYNVRGLEVPDTKLKIAERELEGRFDITWDKAARWKSTTSVSGLDYRDNGSGYFNYRERKVAHELEWKSDPWLVRLDGTARRLDFGVQTVGLGIAPPPRLKDEFTTELRVERKLSARWTVFGNYSWERSRSNDVIASYRVNEGLLGVRWSWEK